MNKRKSFWFVIKKEILEEAVKKSFNYSDILRYFNFPRNGSNLKNLKTRLEQDKIETNHFITSSSTIKKNKEIFTKNSLCTNSTLKKRILKDNLKEYKCEGIDCKIINDWNGKLLSLQLDHINGINNDNRLKNLRFLCPNCHSQTSTFGSKNIKREFKILSKKKSRRECRSCGKIIRNSKKGCNICFPSNEKVGKRFNIEKDMLIELLKNNNMSQIAKDYGVSSNAIKKRCKKLGIWENYKEKLQNEKETKNKIKLEKNIKKNLVLKLRNNRNNLIKKLFNQGKSSLEISRITGIPRTTVRDFINKITTS